MPRQNKSDQFAQSERMRQELEAKAVLDLNKAIELMNAPSETTHSCGKKRIADEALLEIFAQDDDYEDTDEPDVLDDELDCTEDDIDTSG